jgi:ATP-dependent helicase/nuclease subunit A
MAEGNVVVAAGAGSGKTTVLAARYVRLIETGRMPGILPVGERVHVRNVLVLTFTRKAAAEMYARINGALAAASEEASESALKEGNGIVVPAGAGDGVAEHLAACLSDFSEAQISTFDSFAARVARSGSSRFGLAPDFVVDEERAGKLARDLALSFILEHREEDAIRDLVSAAGLEGARDDILADLAVHRMSLSSPPDFPAFHARQSERLDEMAAETREDILSMRAAVLDYALSETTPTSRAWLDALATNPEGGAPGETDDGEKEFLSFISRFENLRKPASNSKDETSLFLSDCVPALKKTAAAYRDIAATRQAHPGRLALFRLLDEFRAQWDAIRRSEKTLTFRDVAQLALDVLKADPAIRGYYRDLYRYVMIDEFQDDDELQKEVLFLLAGEDSPGESSPSEAEGFARHTLAQDKLFFVGDEKQSIYLFRGADVSVFRRLPGELAASRAAEPGSTALSLSRNFRSEPGLIDMINAIFPAVMAPRDAEAGLEDFEARFEALESRPPTPGVEPRFVYLELPRRENAAADIRDAAEAEAWEVARIVRDAVAGGSFLVADRKAGVARKAGYEDFAVLLRSTGNQVHFEKYFRLFGVPYGSENACGLFSEAVACDLYYALRLALYPEDRNALAAYLRSPFAGLSDESLVRLLGVAPESSGSKPDPFGSGASALLPERDRDGWERGAATLRTVASMAGRAPIAACLSFLWFEAGYRAALLRDPVASAFEEHFELVHTMAAQADARGESLAAFVARLESLVGRPDKLEVELPRDSSRGVRIMTIHKSKGLEFPIVIVPQANNVGMDRTAGDSWYWVETLGPTFRPPATVGSRSRNAFFENAKERRTAMESAELKRLLYVALTRAESHIIITATEPRNDDAKGRSFRSLLAPPLGLFASPSPLSLTGANVGAGNATPKLDLPPFGDLSVLPSGALVGFLPERSDREYFALVAGAKRRGDAAIDFSAIPSVERPTWPRSASVSSIAERYAERYAEEPLATQESLEISPEIAAPHGLTSDIWGTLVHAILESRLKLREGEFRLSPALEDALESSLGGGGAVREAMSKAERLAEVFLESELGHRALGSSERYVEMKIAIGLRADPPERSKASSAALERARGSIDLAFVEAERVVVVDYKTDSAIAPGLHDLQVAAYKRAASEIFGRPAEAWIFYLYGGGRALLVDEDGSAPRLEDAPDPRPNLAPIFGNPLIY